MVAAGKDSGQGVFGLLAEFRVLDFVDVLGHGHEVGLAVGGGFEHGAVDDTEFEEGEGDPCPDWVWGGLVFDGVVEVFDGGVGGVEQLLTAAGAGFFASGEDGVAVAGSAAHPVMDGGAVDSADARGGGDGGSFGEEGEDFALLEGKRLEIELKEGIGFHVARFITGSREGWRARNT